MAWITCVCCGKKDWMCESCMPKQESHADPPEPLQEATNRTMKGYRDWCRKYLKDHPEAVYRDARLAYREEVMGIGKKANEEKAKPWKYNKGKAPHERNFAEIPEPK